MVRGLAMVRYRLLPSTGDRFKRSRNGLSLFFTVKTSLKTLNSLQIQSTLSQDTHTHIHEEQVNELSINGGWGGLWSRGALLW